MASMCTFFEDVEQRQCTWHLYNNFKLIHQSLSLKNLFWSVAREKTISDWNVEMVKLKELDANAYDGKRRKRQLNGAQHILGILQVQHSTQQHL